MWSEDENSKKRKSDREDEEGEDEDIFKKSKKMGRSPVKSQRKMEENIEKMMDMLHMMGKRVNDVSEQIKSMREEQREYREEIAKLRMENKNLGVENEKMKNVISDMETRLERLENDKRRNNIVLQGLSINSNDQEVLKETMVKFMEKQLNINVGIRSSTKLGEKTYLISLTDQMEKIKVMQNKNKLRRMTEEKIFIQDDLSKKDRNIQQQIRIRAKEEKDRGNTVKIGYRKLFINGIEWKWNSTESKLQEKIDSINPKN